MTNNDILRRIRYISDFNDSKMIKIFNLADSQVSREELSNWLKKDDDPAFEKLNDKQLAMFLNGLINELRGKKEGVQPPLEKTLSNNIIFRKLKIAFNLQAGDIIEILQLADFNLSKHELSAFFRNKNHKHYRECKEQVLRCFLQGLQIKHRNSNE